PVTSTHPFTPSPSIPSSPTRRSSDLRQARRHSFGFQLRDVLPKIEIQFFGDCAAVDRISHARNLDESVALNQRHHRILQTQPFVDRKSTRLNSSHQIISYAVFCLKKK